MNYNFDEIIDRRHTNSMKWDCSALLMDMGMLDHFDENTIPAFTADMDFRCAKPIIDALQKVVEHGIFGYAGQSGNPEYNKAIQGWFRRRHNWEFEEEAIVYVDGTVEAAEIAIEAFTQEGEGVMITRPVYGPFTTVIEGTHRRVVNSSLVNTDGYYTLNFEDIEEKAKDPGVKIFLLCSPQNPTGRVWTEEELKKLSDICVRNGMLLVSDEVHCDILRKGVKFISAGKVGDPGNTIVLTAINKTFNCAGLHCSHAIIADSKLREQYQKTILGLHTPNQFAIAAVIAAYNEGEEWLDQVLEYIDGTMDWAIEFLKNEMPKVKVRKPEGTYILWMDFRDTGLLPEEIHDRIYKKANVALEGGTAFDPEGGAGFERICVPAPRPLMKEAFQRIAKQFEDCR